METFATDHPDSINYTFIQGKTESAIPYLKYDGFNRRYFWITKEWVDEIDIQQMDPKIITPNVPISMDLSNVSENDRLRLSETMDHSEFFSMVFKEKYKYLEWFENVDGILEKFILRLERV